MIAAGTIAALPAPFNTWCCGWRAIRVDGAKHVCPRCGLVVWDGPALVRDVFGPGVTRCVTPRQPITPTFVWDAFDRWCDV